MQLHTLQVVRKYLTPGERDASLRAAERAGRPFRPFCMLLTYSRLSEALAVTANRVDLLLAS